MAERIVADDPFDEAPPGAAPALLIDDTPAPEVAGRRRSPVWWCQWAIVVAGVVLHGWAMWGGFFHMDDFFYLADAQRPFDEYVLQIYNNHLMPAEFAVVWVSQLIAPMSWPLAVGVITGLNITTGGYVEQGTLIVKLQDEEETIALEQARIQLEDAKAEETRIKRLQASGATTEVRLRETELLLRNAELAVRQAEFELSQCQIIAPISGWVGITDLEEGDRVNAQDELVTITDRSDILIDFRVPERAVRNIKVGQSFEVMPLGFDDKTLIGEINAVDSVVDRASRTLRVQGRVPNEADLLRAGMAFSVNLSFPGETLLSIAPLAVQWSSDGPFVWAVREGKVVQVTVEIIQRNSEEVLVASEGLSAGDLVVTEGVQTLRQGAEVNVSEEEVSAAAPAGGPKL